MTRSQSATKHTPRWKVLETVVAALERSLATVEGTKVSANAKVPERATGRPRQVDVLVEFPASGRDFRIGLEVRDKQAAVSLPEIEGLIAKLGKLDIDKGAVVSRSAYTTEARAAGAAAGVLTLSIAEAELPSWWEATTMEVRVISRSVQEVAFEYGDDADAVLQEYPDLAAHWKSITVVWPSARRTLTDQIDGDVDRIIQGADLPLEFAGLLAIPIDYKGTECRFELDGATIPLPDLVRVNVHFSRRTEQVQLAAFDGDGRLAVTGVSQSLSRQFTFVISETEEGHQLRVSVDDPQSAPVHVSRRVG